MEEQDDFQAKILSFAKSNFLILALFSLGVIFIGVGLVQMLGASKPTIKFETGKGVGEVEAASDTAIKVDVEGEVIHPGLYSLKGDARVQDALIAAGGLTQDANRASINLAQKIADGQKVYVPKIGEVSSPSVSTGVASNGLVSINQATAKELEDLPGIGPVSAKKIIDSRPYGSIDELKTKKVVGSSIFEKISQLISI